MSETRRAILKRAVLLVGGAAGLLAGREVLQRSSASTSETLTLEGRGWHIHSRELAKGRLPAGGERMVAYGELHAPAGETQVGDFFATYFSLPPAGSGGRFASIEHHTFHLSDGSIMGTGTTKPDLDSEDEFAIVGGTGRYAGARGTYIVRQSHQEFGGDGTALISFKLITEAGHGS